MIQMPLAMIAQPFAQQPASKQGAAAGPDFAELFTQHEGAGAEIEAEPEVAIDPIDPPEVDAEQVESEEGFADAPPVPVSEGPSAHPVVPVVPKEVEHEAPQPDASEVEGGDDVPITFVSIAEVRTPATPVQLAASAPIIVASAVMGKEPAPPVDEDGEVPAGPKTDVARPAPEMRAPVPPRATGAVVNPPAQEGPIPAAVRTPPQDDSASSVTFPAPAKDVAAPAASAAPVAPVLQLQPDQPSPLPEHVQERVSFSFAPSRSEPPAAVSLSPQMASQVAQALAARPDGQVELRLSPEELGEVRLRLGTGQSEVIVVVQAERPETLDLFRRNIDMLAQEFRNLGYGSVSFQFGRQQSSQRDGGARPAAPTPVLEVAVAPPAPSLAPVTGLDLRL